VLEPPLLYSFTSTDGALSYFFFKTILCNRKIVQYGYGNIRLLLLLLLLLYQMWRKVLNTEVFWRKKYGDDHRLNMESDLRSLFGLHVYCTAVLVVG
jgi:hypothetical protein